MYSVFLHHYTLLLSSYFTGVPLLLNLPRKRGPIFPNSSIININNPYPTAFPYGNGMVLHFYQQQESSTTKIVHKVINTGLKTYVYSLHTGENFH